MKEPLVMLPAMMCDARVFSHQINGLSRDHTIIVAPVGHAPRIEDIAADLLPQLPGRFALMGLSFGGLVAMELYRRAPDRVTRFCLMSCSPLSEPPEEAAAREAQIVAARAGRLDEAVSAAMRAEYLAPGPGRIALQGLLQDMARDQGADVFINQSRALQRRRDQQGTMRRCKVPSHVICGELDSMVPLKRQAFLADLMPNAGLEVISGAGHLPPLEQPDLTLAALRNWLDGPVTLR